MTMAKMIKVVMIITITMIRVVMIIVTSIIMTKIIITATIMIKQPYDIFLLLQTLWIEEDLGLVRQ